MLHNLCGAVGLRDRHGSHSRGLHGDGVGNLCRNLLVEAEDRTELLVEVYVSSAVGSLDAGIVCQLDLLTRLTRFLGHHLLDGVAFGVLGSHQGVAVCGVAVYGNLQHRLGRSGIFCILSHEVGLARQAEDIGLLTYDLRNDDTLGSGAVGTLGNDELTFLADNVLSACKVTFGFDQGFLAVHHTGTGHLAELHYISSFDFHNTFPFF